MYTMRPDLSLGAFGHGRLFGCGHNVMYGPMTTKKSVKLPAPADAYDLNEDERCTPTIPVTKPKSSSKMKGAGCNTMGQASFNPTYALAAVHQAKQFEKKEKKILPGDELLDRILKSTKNKTGMKGKGYQFEGEWMGDNWTQQQSNQRREMLGTGTELYGKASDFESQTGPYDMEQMGGGTTAKGSWIEPLKKSLAHTVVPALLHFKGVDDLEGRRKVGSGGGWAAHYESYAKTLRATTMSDQAVDKFTRQIASTIIDYVNTERRRHNQFDLDKTHRYRLGKAMMAYRYARTHTSVGDEYFWKEVLPYVLQGRLVAWGHIKTGGAYRR